MHADSADQHTAIAHGIDEALGRRGCWRLGGPILDHFNCEEHAVAAHVADERVLVLQTAQSLDDVAADGARIRQQLLAFDHFQNRHADGGGHRIAAEGVEVHVATGECFYKIRASYDASQRMAVAHGFTHGNDIGDRPECGVTPHVRAESAETALHFIRNQQSARFVHDFRGFLQVPRGHHRQPFTRKRRTDQQACKFDALRFEVLDRMTHIRGIGITQRLIVAPMAITVRIEDGERAHERPALFRGREQRADLRHGRRVAVIREGRCDDPLIAGALARDSQRQFVGLTAGAHEHHIRQ